LRGSTYWSYSGSGSYNYPQGLASSIHFLVPFSVVTTTTSGAASGYASASGYLNTTFGDPNWTGSGGATNGSWQNQGSASQTISAFNLASYSGGGSFTQTLTGASASASFSGTTAESGYAQANGYSGTSFSLDNNGSFDGSGGSASGGLSGSTSWSYSGSGSYNYAQNGSGISFLLPFSALTTTTSGTASGYASASGYLNTNFGDPNWTASGGAASTSWQDQGSGSQTVSAFNLASYTGGGSFTQRITGASGASASFSGTTAESGYAQANGFSGTSFGLDSHGSFDGSGGSASGGLSGSTSWSYSGSGSYSYPQGLASGINFLVPFSVTSTTTTGTASGVASASGYLNTTFGDPNWTASGGAASTSWQNQGSASGTVSVFNLASYSGGGSFTQTITGASGASASLSGTTAESGYAQANAFSGTSFSLDNHGSFDGSGGSASGGLSGSTSWSYSGSGSYSYPQGLASGILFLVPFSALTTTTNGSASGYASASGYLNTTFGDPNWTASGGAASTSWQDQGSASQMVSVFNLASYSGGGSFTQTLSGASGASANFSGTTSESGSVQATAFSGTSFALDNLGGFDGSGGSASGNLTGSTNWSYSGAGSYSYPQANASGINFLLPFSAVTKTTTGSASGFASASGYLNTTFGDPNWTASGGASASWQNQGSASQTVSAFNLASYSGGGSFTQNITGASGASASFSGTTAESGYARANAFSGTSFSMDNAGSFDASGGSASGGLSGSTAWSYSGSGSYSYPQANASGINFLVPFSAVTKTTSGSASGFASASGYQNTTFGDPNWTASGGAASGSWQNQGGGSQTVSVFNLASYSGGGSFTQRITGASGASANLSGTTAESGYAQVNAFSGTSFSLDNAGSTDNSGGSASGGLSGSTSWSYSGSGSYSYQQNGALLSFLVPFSAVTTTTSGTASGYASASGYQNTTFGDPNWTASGGAARASWQTQGSGSQTVSVFNLASYSGGGSFTQNITGASSASATLSGTTSESGYAQASAFTATSFALTNSGSCDGSGGSASGGMSGSTAWSYSGSGTYSYP
jgi:hypothetical protein